MKSKIWGGKRDKAGRQSGQLALFGSETRFHVLRVMVYTGIKQSFSITTIKKEIEKNAQKTFNYSGVSKVIDDLVDWNMVKEIKINDKTSIYKINTKFPSYQKIQDFFEYIETRKDFQKLFFIKK